MHIEVDSSSSNPCCSRVNSIFRVESYRDANVKRKSRISPTESGFHIAIKEICMHPYLVRRHHLILKHMLHGGTLGSVPG